MHNVLDMRRPFRSRCFGTCHFCIKTSLHGYKLHAIVRNLAELKLRFSVISYLSYHSFNILDDLPKSDISYFLSITVPSAIRIRTLQSPKFRSPNKLLLKFRFPKQNFVVCGTKCHQKFEWYGNNGCIKKSTKIWIRSLRDIPQFWQISSNSMKFALITFAQYCRIWRKLFFRISRI